MFDTDIFPGPPEADVQHQVLDQWMRNPFLDDDAESLSLRLGIPPSEIKDAIAALCASRFLRNGTSSGYMLLMDLEEEEVDEEVAAEETVLQASSPPTASDLLHSAAAAAAAVDGGTESRTSGSEDLLRPLVSPLGLEGLLSSADAAFEQLVEALPFGVVVLQENGCLELANDKALRWLDMPIDLLDAATFEIVTGVNPLPVAMGEPPISFSMSIPHPVEVAMHKCQLPSGPGVLIALTDVSLQEEVNRLQAELQEELFNRLRQEMVSPLFMIGKFLDHPDAVGLGQARAAMEQINWFFRTYLLAATDESR